MVGAPDECWLWQGRTQQGYGVLDCFGGSELAHRVSYSLLHQRWPSGCTMHRCDTPGCVNPTHLREGSWAENNADRAAKRRSAKRVVRAGYLTADGVLEAQRQRRAGKALREVAAFLGCDLSTVSKIARGQHVRTLHVG